MILTIDVGNSQILGGLWKDGELVLRFRRVTVPSTSSDELGLFLRSVIRENGHDPASVRDAAFCSVVPAINHSLASACVKYFRLEPLVVQAGAKTGLKLRYGNPKEIGADRIVNAVGGIALYPDRDMVIVDMGTATTFDAVTRDRTYLGGSIASGLKMSMNALAAGTAKLPTVEILSAGSACGGSTVEAIQSGLYFGHVGLIREMARRFETECFDGRKPLLIGTGGFARLFEKEGLFDAIEPDLVLTGLMRALEMNR